jgi:signal transduction histidine kinase
MSRSRRSWLVAALLAVLGVTASVAVWWELRAHERAQSERTSQAVAAGLAGGLEATLASRVQTARAAAQVWAKDDERSRERWVRDARLYARSNDLVSLTRIDPERPDPWVATATERREPQAADAADARAIDAAVRRAARSGRETAAGPFLTDQGDHVLWVAEPIPYTDREPGALVATLDLDAILSGFLSGRATGYAVTLRGAEEPLFRRGEPSPDAAAATFSLALAGVELQGSVGPTAELAAREATPLPAIVLGAGLLITASLVALSWLAHLARARARSLGDAYQEIGREVAATRSAEAALRKLNSELEARVAERTHELSELVKELEAFTYSVSHDLRSPLGAVVNFASLIEEDYGERLDPEGRDYLDRIHSSADSALALMDGLLAFSRLGRERVNRTRVDMEALVAEVVDELTASESRLDAEIAVGSLPPAHADPTMMRLVVANLVSNALKFSRGGVLPRVEIGASQGDDGEIVYHVRDNGVGFEPQLAHKLFTAFERLHAREQFAGSGVGLASAARVVRRHGGRIWAEGSPGKGAVFYFTLGHGHGRESHVEQS